MGQLKLRVEHKRKTTSLVTRSIFMNEEGAIDLSSIMVGIIVIGLIGGVIAATIFAVIPWVQDNAAKASLDAVVTSESASMGLQNKFQNGAGLNSAGLLPTNPHLSIGTDNTQDCYVGVSRSDSGKYFYVTSKYSVAKEYVSGTATDCLSANDMSLLVEGSNTQVLPTYTNQTIIGWASNDLATVPTDETALSTGDGMLSTYVDFVNHSAFPYDFAKQSSDRSSALLVSWEPWNMDDSTNMNQTSFKPSNVASGAYDSYITNWLQTAEWWGKGNTLMVRFAPEMNDAVRPWSLGTNGGNTAADYIAMWQHVYNIKKQVAPDVIMVWNPLVAGATPSGTATDFSTVYPGAAYVDMLALDGFNWGATKDKTACHWQSYSDVFKNPISQLKTLANGKPWGIAEVGSAYEADADFRSGGVCYNSWGSWVYSSPVSAPYYSTTSDWITQAGWYKTMLQQAHGDGALFVNVFNTVKETDWRINSTASGSAGTGVLTTVRQNPAFVAGNENSGGYIKAAQK